jgi:hypothetical protein
MRQQIPTQGVPRHPQLALAVDGTITVAWDEQLKGTRRIVVATGTRDSTNSVRFVRRSVSDGPGTYPVVASQAGAAIVAWTSGTAGDTVLRVERHPAVR